MPGHVRACTISDVSGVFEKKTGKKLAIFFAKMLDFGLLDANLRGFEAPFFKIFSSRRAPLAGGDGRAL